MAHTRTFIRLILLLVGVGVPSLCPFAACDSEFTNRCAAEEIDCFVVCPTNFRESLAPWIAYRQSEGLTVRVIPSAGSASQVKDKLTEAGFGPKTKFLVLIGDCRLAAAETADPSLETPTFYRQPGPTAKFGTTKTLAGDAPYGDLDEDGVPEVAIGRLPVDTPEQLARWIDRIQAYEASADFGPWRDRVQITAGVGGFGFLADAAIESATRGILTSALPAPVQLGVTYASPSSPFNPGAIDFFPATLRRYREGGLFWVYLGHGNVTALDRVPGPGGQKRPVLDCEDLNLLERPAGEAPIALLLACYTGAFDASVDCLAEQMVQCPGGPIAILAGSRVTMPYGNAIAAQGLIHAVYQDKVDRLGTAWLATQRELATKTDANDELKSRRKLVDMLAKALSPDAEQLPAERLEHVHLYNLLGDPTLRLRHPSEVTIDVPKGVQQGEPLVVQGHAPRGGHLVVSLCHLPGGVPVAGGSPSSERYEQANCVDVLSEELENHPGGKFEVTIHPPVDLVGRFRVVARVHDTTGWSTGAASVLIRP